MVDENLLTIRDLLTCVRHSEHDRCLLKNCGLTNFIYSQDVAKVEDIGLQKG